MAVQLVNSDKVWKAEVQQEARKKNRYSERQPQKIKAVFTLTLKVAFFPPSTLSARLQMEKIKKDSVTGITAGICPLQGEQALNDDKQRERWRKWS